MPIAVLKSVREVSSEDPVHTAENLLKENAGKKWRTKSGGEKSAYVILEFQEAQQITGIDIGNEHSAFIEVRVSRTMVPDDFRELLLSSSFMTPVESKNSGNQNRVRCFSGSALDEAALKEKWRLLKIVCTQPFNRHVQYGLSFVKVHVAASSAAAAPVPAPAKVKSLVPERMMQFGAFKLREESPDSDTDAQLTRFQSWKKESHLQPATTAAAIRDAGSSALRRLSHGKPSVSPSPSPSSAFRQSGGDSPTPAASEAKPLDRNRASLLFGEDDDDEESQNEASAKKRRLSKHLEADKDRRRLEQEKELERKKEKSKRQSLDKTTSKEEKPAKKEEKSSAKEKSFRKEEKSSSRKEDKSSHNRSRDTSKAKDTSMTRDSPRPSAQKRLSSPSGPSAAATTPAKKQKLKEENIQYRPFNQLLSGVVLLSQLSFLFQNPDRADLRAKATALGARYKADWEPGCTHLICAFKNTPKYLQVRGKGKIVTRSWIEKCYALKKYLPWRRYALDTMDLGQPESDEEVCDEAVKPTSRRESREDDVTVTEDIKIASNYDADRKDNKKQEQAQDASSGIDTEDELERVVQETKTKNPKIKTPPKSKSKDIYEVSTDEEDYLVEKKEQLVLD
ncbi:hypothetical protein KR009_005615 [Drosophila setifemur]|nr:hypothetical protein KR009_005615 [Drosophila setifemur]